MCGQPASKKEAAKPGQKCVVLLMKKYERVKILGSKENLAEDSAVPKEQPIYGDYRMTVLVKNHLTKLYPLFLRLSPL